MANLKLLLEKLPLSRMPFGRRIQAWLGLGRRYGLKFNGSVEITGFVSEGEAEAWVRDQGSRVRNYVIFMYEPIDLRVLNEGSRERTTDRPPQA